MSATMSTGATLSLSKSYILEKYFLELQKFWETEKRLKGTGEICFLQAEAANSSSEAANLQNQLQSIGSGLVGIRNTLKENGLRDEIVTSGNTLSDQSNPEKISESRDHPDIIRTTTGNYQQQRQQQNYCNVDNGNGYQGDGFETLRSVRSHVTEVSSVMTANVSDPPSSNGSARLAVSGSNNSSHNSNVIVSPSQLSPPPISTLQHNYSNIPHPQPAPLMPSLPLNGPQRPQGPSSLPSAENSPAGGSSPFQLGLPAPGVESAAGNAFLSGSESGGGAFSRSAVRPRTPQEEKVRRRERNLAEEFRKSKLTELQDLIHLDTPLSEDSIMRALQSRFFNQKYFTNVGPIVLSMNPYRDVGNPLTLTSVRNLPRSPELTKVVKEVVRLQSESGYPQAIIASGASGSGKTHTSMILLRQLFEVASVGGGTETDTFKHLSAAFTVLRSLGSAKTASNRESSRIGHFIEVQVSDGTLYRTKIHCYFLDHSRVVKPLPMDKNYHIFYQMLAGLTSSERKQLGLDGYQIHDLFFLNVGDTRTEDENQDAHRFAEWKASLSVLGIPFMDVVRVLASILLLGNVEFSTRGDDGFDVEIIGETELNAVSSLLGVPTSMLCQGLTSRTHLVRGQPVKSMSDANLCNATRNALAKSLYCRTVATIVRRANSLKKPVGPLSGTMSSDSNESVHHEVASHHASTVGTAGSKKSAKSMAILNNAVRHATDGFIGILDMFGFEDSKPSQLEQLCINLCSETMQHFYNTHIFKSSLESCREEGIVPSHVMIDYVDNVPVIDLISSLRTGLLSMLDVECSVRGLPGTYVQKVKLQHKENMKLFEPKHCDISRTFGIHHYAGQVIYDTADFLDTNKDVIPDDLVCVFHRETCNFGFATHLFGNETKTMHSTRLNTGMPNVVLPRGAMFRISPTSQSELLNGDEPVSTLTQDFHTRLDNLLRTLVHAKPHFVRCLRPNEHESLTEFDRSLVVQQIRSLQILETVNLMAGGFPHKMRFKAFNSQYRVLAPSKSLFRSPEKAVDDCETILDCYSRNLKAIPPENLPRNTEWAHGRKHIFLSEGARQQLERMREETRQQSAIEIQKTYRGFRVRKMLQTKPVNRQASNVQSLSSVSTGTTNNSMTQALNNNNMRMSLRSGTRPRPQPISGSLPLDFMQNDKCDFQVIQKTCALFGLDLERPPPIPQSRQYTVMGNKKVTYPQTRVMKHSFPDNSGSEVTLVRGETIIVIGVSPKRGHLVVEKQNHTFHVPFQYLEMKPLTGN